MIRYILALGLVILRAVLPLYWLLIQAAILVFIAFFNFEVYKQTLETTPRTLKTVKNNQAHRLFFFR